MNGTFSGEQIYLFALFLYTLSCVLATTTFQDTQGICTLLGIASLVLLAGKVLFLDTYSIKEAILPGIMLVNLGFIFLSTRNFTLVGRILFIICAIGVDYRKILKVHLLGHFSVYSAAIIASCMYVIENVKMDTVDAGRGIRNSFGICYPTDFGAHSFYILLTFLYLYYKKIRWYGYLLLVGAVCIIYKYTNTRIDCFCMMMLIVGFALISLYEQKKHNYIDKAYKIRPFLDKVKLLSMPICAIIMLVATILYNEKVELNESLEKEAFTLIRRFVYGKRMLESRRLNLFGQNINWIGWGDRNVNSLMEYNFVDCAYIKNVYDYGLVFGIGIIVLMVYLCYRKKSDRAFIFVIFVLSLNNMIAHHMMETSYDPFVLLIFSKIIYDETDNKKGDIRRDAKGRI